MERFLGLVATRPMLRFYVDHKDGCRPVWRIFAQGAVRCYNGLLSLHSHLFGTLNRPRTALERMRRFSPGRGSAGENRSQPTHRSSGRGSWSMFGHRARGLAVIMLTTGISSLLTITSRAEEST